MFNTAAFHSSRWLLNDLFKGFTKPMFGMEQDARDTRAMATLAYVDLVADRFPDVAVNWASAVTSFTAPGSEIQHEAIGHMLDHLPAAYRLDPATTSRAFMVAGLRCRDPRMEACINERFYEVARDELPGPWGGLMKDIAPVEP